MMKKIIALILALTFVLALSGCTKADKGRTMYNYKMGKFVELGEYKGIEVDTSSAEYKKTYDGIMTDDVQNNGLYIKITEGKLKKGDVANINYAGKIDGVAFEGGTAENQELELGSGQFIPGFEDKLIGVEIGKTVDLNLVFPKDYSNADLAGKAVVFTVKVNFVVIYDKMTEGKLKKGDTANIDFEGKLNGKAFDGGTSKGYDLTLGSGQFIPGFEDKLIGVEIGDTVDLDLTFPTNYSAELAGKDVVFTVTVNYATRKRAKTPDEYYKDLGFKTVEEYYDDVKKDTISNMALTKVFTDSKVKKYPEDEKNKLIEPVKSSIETAAQQQGVTADVYVNYYTGMTFDEYIEEVIKTEIEPLMQKRMIIYAIFDAVGFKLDKDELVKFTRKEIASYENDEVTEKSLKEAYGEDYFETMYIQEKVVDYLSENTKVS